MKINEKIYGFRVNEVSDIPSISACLYMLEHERSGARLLYLEEDYDCKTFGITFGTVPTDDTGVFHILEHAVLCGSEKFPMKEPFTELLKGSLNSYLNAFTYNDKTCYPVSSRNDRDFYNLVNVYMDAVFNPKATENENIFRQEGWRYEPDGDGFTYNGVVYSEMCGAYASPDELAAYHTGRLMFPGGTYSYDAGGNPDAIPDLTYRDFCLAHKKFYHPENSYIFLHGKPNLDALLPLISSYLEKYERCSFKYVIEKGGEPITDTVTVPYDADSEDTDTRLYVNYLTYEITEYSKLAALQMLIMALTDSNDAPLKKRLLDTGLFENVYISATPSARYNTLSFEFHGVKAGRESELRERLSEILRELLCEGFDEELIAATVDLQEFKLREADFGSCPKGISYLLLLNDAWPYGIHPVDVLDFEPQLAFLREKLNTGYYRELLSEVIEHPHTTLILTPSDTVAEERRRACDTAIAERISAMGAGASEALRAWHKSFLLWQKTPDTREALATLPTLPIKDVDTTPKEIITVASELSGATLLHHKIQTNGITYAEMYFDASDLTAEELTVLSLLARSWRELDTALGTANDFSKRAKRVLGQISVTTTALKRENETRCYLVVSFSCLDKKRPEALALVREYLTMKKIRDEKKISRRISQTVLALRDAITESGNAYAAGRTSARYSLLHTAREYTHGIELYLAARRLSLSDGKAIAGLSEKMAALAERIIAKERLTLAISGDTPRPFADELISALPVGEKPCALKIDLLPARCEGIVIPGEVSYAARGSDLLSVTDRRHGSWSTLATILNYEILWNEIRLKGGAYGVGFAARANTGSLIFTTYRDPAPITSLEVFSSAGERVRRFAEECTDITKFIIGTIGAALPLTTPAQDGEGATQLYMSGKCHRDNVIHLSEIAATTREDLLLLAELLDRLDKKATSCVVGPSEVIARLAPDAVIEI